MSDNIETTVRTFDHPVFGSIRIVDQNGEEWFIARDVALALGYGDTDQAIRQHCKKAIDLPSPKSSINSNPDETTGLKSLTKNVPSPKIIPVSDVCRLIMRSNMPKALEFQDWVMDDVIPSIYKTGSYSLTSIPPIPLLIDQLRVHFFDYLKHYQFIQAAIFREFVLKDFGFDLVKAFPEDIQIIIGDEFCKVKYIVTLCYWMHGITEDKANKVLVDCGFQEPLEDVFVPTKLGTYFCKVLMSTRSRRNKPKYRELQWNPLVCSIASRILFLEHYEEVRKEAEALNQKMFPIPGDEAIRENLDLAVDKCTRKVQALDPKFIRGSWYNTELCEERMRRNIQFKLLEAFKNDTPIPDLLPLVNPL